MSMVPSNNVKMAEKPSSGICKVDPHLRSTLDITGCRVHATDGNIGHVEDFIVDDKTWGIRYLVVNTWNWLPDRRVLVSPQWITRMNWADKKAFVDLSRDAVRKSPKFEPSKPISLDFEGKLLGHLEKPEFKEWVIFNFRAPPGVEVCVAGTFNNWDPTSIRLRGNSKGTYTATVLLPPGQYEHKFIVNGDWRNDPECSEQVPNAFGTTNSVLVVSRASAHSGHLHTFPQSPVTFERPMWSTLSEG